MYFYYDWIEPLKKVPSEDFKKLVIAMAEYHQSGKEPPSLEGYAGMAADFIFPQIKRSKQYAENGSKGGATTQSKALASTVGSTNGSSLKHKLKRNTKTKTNTSAAPSLEGAASRAREGSFDADEFFNAAVARTYGENEEKADKR